MSHPGDWRWSAGPLDYRPTIAVIEQPTPDKRERAAQRVERVPFGFARALMPTGLCGFPNRNGRLGGCIEPIAHEGPHRWATGDQRGAVRSTWPQPTP